MYIFAMEEKKIYIYIFQRLLNDFGQILKMIQF